MVSLGAAIAATRCRGGPLYPFRRCRSEASSTFPNPSRYHLQNVPYVLLTSSKCPIQNCSPVRSPAQGTRLRATPADKERISVPGQNASSGSIPQNRARLPFPAPNLQALPARPKGEQKNNRDTKILLIPLSFRKQRPEPQTIGTQGGTP
jgi:hypothetical protein